MADSNEPSSETTKFACAGQVFAAAVANSGRPAVGTALWSWQAAASARSRGTAWVMRFMSGLLVQDVDGDVLVRPDLAGTARWNRNPHDVAAAVGRHGGRHARLVLPEPREGDLVRAARALRVHTTGRPVHRDHAGRTAEGEEGGIAARVGAQAELLAPAADVLCRDRPEALDKHAVEEGVALLHEVRQKRLGVGHRAAAVNAQAPEREAARVPRRPTEPVHVAEVTVRDEVGLVARPSPAARQRVGRGREARPRAVRRRVLACAEYGNEREPGPPNKRADVHRDLLLILLPGHRNGPGRIGVSKHRVRGSSRTQVIVAPAPVAPARQPSLVLRPRKAHSGTPYATVISMTRDAPFGGSTAGDSSGGVARFPRQPLPTEQSVLWRPAVQELARPDDEPS